MLKSFATTVQTPAKWVGRDAPSITSVSADTSTEVSTADRPPGYISSTDGVNSTSLPGRLHLGGVTVGVAGIGVEVLGRRELQRVDEDRGGHDVAVGPGALDQRDVAVVEVAHGRHQTDGAARPPLGIERGAQPGDGGLGPHEATGIRDGIPARTTPHGPSREPGRPSTRSATRP